MINFHMTYQGKGGCGKSLAALLLVEWAQSTGRRLKALDADQVTPTLSSYKALGAEAVELIGRNKKLDETAFEAMYMRVMSDPNEYLLDIGTSVFFDIDRHIQHVQVFPVLIDGGRLPNLHVPITGGSDHEETVKSAVYVFERARAAAEEHRPRIVLWLNEEKGPVLWKDRPFEASSIFEEFKDVIHGVVKIPEQDESGNKVLTKMLQQKRTFGETIDDPATNVFDRTRLFRWRGQVFASLDAIFGARAAA